MIKQDLNTLKTDLVFELRYNCQSDDFCLRRSITEFGQLRPIIIDQNNNIVDGFKMYQILTDLGMTQGLVKQITTDNYIRTRLELNLFDKKLDPIPIIQQFEKLGEAELLKMNSPFPRQDMIGWIKMLTWDWTIYKNKEMEGSVLW